MQAPLKRDPLLDQADAAMANARHLRDQLSDRIAIAHDQCRRTQQRQILQTELDPALSISLLVRADAFAKPSV